MSSSIDELVSLLDNKQGELFMNRLLGLNREEQIELVEVVNRTRPHYVISSKYPHWIVANFFHILKSKGYFDDPVALINRFPQDTRRSLLDKYLRVLFSGVEEKEGLGELTEIIEQRNLTGKVLSHGFDPFSNDRLMLIRTLSDDFGRAFSQVREHLHSSLFPVPRVNQFVSVYRRLVENEGLVRRLYAYKQKDKSNHLKVDFLPFLGLLFPHREDVFVPEGEVFFDSSDEDVIEEKDGRVYIPCRKVLPGKSDHEFCEALRSMVKSMHERNIDVNKYVRESYSGKYEGEADKVLERLREVAKLRYDYGVGLADFDDLFGCLKIYGKVPHCTLIRTLGEGADSVVYHAHHEFLGEVKVKVFKDNPEDKIKEAMEKEGITLEERIKRRIALFDKRIRDRSHIAQLYEVGRTSSEKGKQTIYIVSDYVDAGAAEEKVNGQYRIREDITEVHIRDIFSKVLAGLGALHDAERILKDVKLRNILVSKDHKTVLIDDLETVTDVTGQDDFLAFKREYPDLEGLGWMNDYPVERLTEGSDRYAAPEVRSDITDASKRSDLYSAAVCMLYIRTRKPTFIATINALDKEDYEKELEKMFKQEGLNEAEQRFFRKGLAYKPEERFQSVDELKTAMEQTF